MPQAPVATVHNFADLPVDRPMPLLERRRVMGEQMMVSHIALRKGFKVATHSHANEQMSVVLSGRIRFGVGAEGSAERYSVDVAADQVIHLPSNVPHSAEAIEDTLVLDLFSPPSATTGIDQPHGR
jgi:quercetin dioxygenase-like cupin family protein